jgi:hypothetical protein
MLVAKQSCGVCLDTATKRQLGTAVSLNFPQRSFLNDLISSTSAGAHRSVQDMDEADNRQRSFIQLLAAQIFSQICKSNSEINSAFCKQMPAEC